MSDYLPKDVRDSLLDGDLRKRQPGTAAKKKTKSQKMPRLRIEVDGRSFTILKYTSQGFSVKACDVPRLPGMVNLFDGTRHLSRCLVVATTEHGGERQYEFKRNQPILDQPPLDYAHDPFEQAFDLT